MTEEFDKEIDTLLRQAAQSVDTVSGQNLHPDADEINAFAENALPAKARLRTMEHLADCSRCRKILSDVIAFHSETKSEIVPLIETKTIAAPWYKRLFVFPQIAYVMGALALIFTGIFGIAVLQNSSDRNSSQIAQVEDKSFSDTGSPAISQNSSESVNTTANSTMAANTSTGTLYSSNTNMSAATAETSRNKEVLPSPTAAPNLDAPADRVDEDRAAKPDPKPVTSLNEETESDKKEKAEAPATVAGAPPPPARENTYSVDGNDSIVSKQQTESRAQNSVVQNQTADQTKIMPDSRNAKNIQNLPINGRSTQPMQMSTGGAAKDGKDKERRVETRTVGGKNFRRADGVWYDVKYNNQKTINVSRGSDDYKKLDGGLRSIAENLGGVVVVIWKEKAYRIQ